MTQEQLNLLGMVLMPLTYGFIGWITNVLALKMTFYPLEFVGIKPPYLGWQGIVPRKAQKLALKSVNIMTEKLIKVDEFFTKIDPDEMEKQFQPVIEELLPIVVEEVIDVVPSLKEKLTDSEKPKFIDQIHQQTGHVVKNITVQVRENPKEVFNLRSLVLKKLTGPNVEKIVNIFQEVGDKEFTFIERSGFYFGFILGILQAGFWAIFPQWWTLPLQGIFVGYITNWLAIVMIFRPLYEKKIGPFRYRGLFLKRQEEVSQKYSNMFATQILTGRNVLEEVLYRRVARQITEAIQSTAKNYVSDLEINSDIFSKLEEIKKQVIQQIIDKMHDKAEKLEHYMNRAMSIEKNMFAKMKVLPPEEFEPILRSAFQEDEYILIVIGSALGGIVGLFQAFYMIWSAV